ncbi:hypothetical protein [Sphingomonas bacterium]|uniref:hypothetical protein n=1 Tax=Sphingomonas bacterium TaxID=1895847 RepID=UPI0015756610|nr:hypothetical protein [Sphingomonas bacterium]
MISARRHFWTELAFFIGSVGAMFAFVWGMTWSYPLGHTTLWSIGMVAVASVAAMGLPSLARAWNAWRRA